jgi:hypothetical protein
MKKQTFEILPLKIIILLSAVVLVWSCNDSRFVTAIESIQNQLQEAMQTGKTEYEVKIPAAPQTKIIYFYPYTDFENTPLENSAREELKTIAFSIEKPLLAVIDAGKVVKCGEAPRFLKPAGTMPMIWTAQNGFITIKIQRNSDGSYNLIKDKEKK